MKSNYKPIGDFIRLVDIRNKELKNLELVGVTVNKRFIPSVANIIGSDMTNYKIIKKNQFACSLMQVRRDGKIPVALFDEGEAIISQAYPVFEIVDTNELLPQYLMMWMTRSEFDREACFYAVGGVRGSLEWEDFCAMQLPVPSIEKQKEIIKEYHTITDRIKLNEQLNQKLEDTAQSIYKEWFVNFEFPDENGKPYKSNGGEMVYCEELDMEIPKGWKLSIIANEIDYKKGFAFKSDNYVENGVGIVRVSNFTYNSIDVSDCNYISKLYAHNYEQYNLETNDIIISTVGSWPNNPDSIVGKVVNVPISANNYLLNQNTVRLRMKNFQLQKYLYFHIKNKKYSDYILSGAQGSANQASVTLEHLFSYPILKLTDNVVENFFNIFNKLSTQQNILNSENTKLESLKKVLLSKMATIEE
ncbi:restriction endonuclease subunit S [Aliarcobacter cryaerophilus]|uniref:restriction endonuclease subunit S n=1 Tax=Aliarcobacter cryaerophilus TaxID=28198 RepID=UPI0021B5ADB9|nr:restriction endonuclease subunit S [Aliarcobacter cryaerophilus]MCT7546671.1 restriction endonuclease subunit S [Aliarcobacter cryaerophilus]